jgi:sialidase-1
MSNTIGRSCVVSLLLSAAALCAPLGAAEPNASASFESVPFKAGDDGYFTYRIPSLITTSKGTLLAFCEGRKTTVDDDGNNDLVLRRSFDRGKTWGPLQLVHEEGGDAVITVGNPCAVVDQETGAVWLTMNKENGVVLITSSDDDGKTWSPVRDISAEVVRPGWGWYAMGPGCGVQLRHGKHKGRLVIPANHRTTKDRSGPSSSHVIYSDDHGKSWKIGGDVGPHTNECQVAELHDGTLMINCRNHWGRSGKDPSKKGKRVVAKSTDGGLTWGESMLDEELPEPTCQAGFVAMTKPTADGKTRLVFSNPAARSRDRMTVRLSDDGGDTWPKALLVHPGSTGYSAPAELTDGTIGLLYERADYREIAFAVIELARLQPVKN